MRWCFNYNILYFVWEDQSDATYHIIHTVPINYITVLYESYSTVMQLTGQIQYSYALNWENIANLCKEFIRRILRKQPHK